MWSQGKEHLEPPEAGGGKEGPSSRALGARGPGLTP